MADQVYSPRPVTEPLTGLAWIARTPGEARLAWLPVAAVAGAFVLGLVAGALGAYLGLW